MKIDLLSAADYKSMKNRELGLPMPAKKQDSTSALVIVVKALDSLSDADKQWVLNSAASRWALTVQQQAGGGGAGVGGVGGAPLGSNSSDAQAAIASNSIRAFIRAKKPTTDVQRVACLGAYLAQTTGQHGFTSKDIATAHTDSGGSKINLPRALDNATRRAKYISTRSGHEKQLTTLGEDVVGALPDQTAVKALEEAARVRGGKKGRRGKSAKRV
jgi:hypothetical protein